MITETGNNFYMWNGKLYQSDIIRACIRPKARAIGKLIPKHIKYVNDELQLDTEPYMRFLLEEPNQFMTNQVMMEKIVTQYQLNNNAFIAIHKNADGIPVELFPIDCITVEAEYNSLGQLWLKFLLVNGKEARYPYTDIIHLRQDVNKNLIFGESPQEVLKPLMEIVNTTDQGIVKAIKNSAVIKWLLEFKSSLKKEDIKKEVKEFTDTYLDVDEGVGGAIATDPKYSAKQVEPKDYVPNATQMDKTTQRLLNYFNTNEKIIQNKFNEDEWNSYYEGEIEPFAMQISMEYTRKLLSRMQRFEKESIMFESSNLQYASLDTKLKLVSLVDRGGMPNNEWRKFLNLPPVAGGDELIRRLDTAVVKGGESK
ncbi:phage portal protein [Clostridium perfringens]|uniref:phage portal protein n=1 Tax=Clostridium perfringens TaxID=1502 RepID=UPI00232FA63A|nr:phage portal protein [Clostridium perfringens]MDB2049597.1 phage portal protein [Clostridium perfringens]